MYLGCFLNVSYRNCSIPVMDAVNRIDEAIPMIYQDIHRVKAEVERIANTMTDLGL